jgi:hypothetical protein
VQDALYNVTGRLRDNLFSSTQNNVGTRSSSSVFTDTSPYGRLRDPPPLGSHPSVGVSHSLSRHATFTQSTDPSVGVSHSLSRHASFNQSTDPSVGVSHSLSRHTISQSMDNFGIPRGQSMDNFGIPHGFDRPPSPRLWASHVRSLSLSLSISLSSLS